MMTRPRQSGRLGEPFHFFDSGSEFLSSNDSGSIVISHTSHAAFKGQGRDMPYLVISMCTQGGGHTQRKNKQIHFEDVWKPGKMGLMLPGPGASGFSPQMRSLGIALDPTFLTKLSYKTPALSLLKVVADSLFQDDLISAILIALLRCAEKQGVESEFFHNGVSLIIQRLFERAEQPTHITPAVDYREQGRLDDIYALIEHSLGDELQVKVLAQEAGLNLRTFTQQFKTETGYTPYQYLTYRRMEKAKTLLKDNSSVTDTASAVGYANPAKFAATFRRWVGLPPSDWQRSFHMQ